MDKDVRELIADRERQGWRVEIGKGHAKAFSPDGKTIVTLPLTPSDHRWKQNALRYLRRGGYQPRKE